jgi:TPP-dependent pyruvate/acetoin dehydrogenase alpha subunit
VPARAGALGDRHIEDADPVVRTRARILASGSLSERALKALEKEIRETVVAAAAFARAEPAPEPGDLLASVEA